MKTSHIILITLVACVAAYLYSGFKPVWDYGHLEQNVRRVITAAELQAWATNVLAHYTNDDTPLTVSELGTNFPPQLRRLAPKIGPHIYVHVPGANELPYIQIWWGSGFLGASGFYLGSTNFAYSGWTNSAGYIRKEDSYYWHVWRPGVWFYQSG